jgi:hypothetical protein
LNRIEVLKHMSIFVVKMLTILGFIFFAGGPVDAVKLALLDDPQMTEPTMDCVSCEKVAVLDLSRQEPGLALRPAVGGAFWDANSMSYNGKMGAEPAWEDRGGMSASQGME